MIGVLRGAITLLLLFLFVALTAATWSPRRKPQFDAAARLPFDDEDSGAGAEEPRP